MERDHLDRWIPAHEAAWRAPGTGAAAAPFTDDATQEWPLAPGPSVG